MIFKNIPIILVAALAPAPLFAADIIVTPNNPLELSDIEIDHIDGSSVIISNLNISVQNPSETEKSNITLNHKLGFVVERSELTLNQGVLNIKNESESKNLSFSDSSFQFGSASSSTTINTEGLIQFSYDSSSSITNTSLYIKSGDFQFFDNRNANTHFSSITVNSGGQLIIHALGVYSTANLQIEESAAAYFSTTSLTGNISSQAGFISDSTLSNLNIEYAAITHKSHLTLDNVVLTDSTLTANNLTLVQRDVDASQTLSIDTVASISGDLTLNVYLADIDSLGVDFSFSADGITSLTDSNLAINFYDSLTNELYATGTDFTLNSGVYTSSVEFIPEPSTATLSFLALAGLLARRRRKVA